MQNCIQKFTRAPIEYINQLRQLKTNSITMKGTTFYPAFPLALITSLLCICGLSTYMIYYFFTIDQNVCYKHITYGIIVLAIVYPIQSIILYICMFGSVALAQTHCWKIFSMVFFGLIVTGFSFGGLGFAFLCTISQVHPLLIPSNFLSSNTFIQIIVYVYLSFVVLYLLLVPLLTISYNQRNKDPKPQASCCDTFCCVIYYICQILFMFTALFMICIKLLGPPLLIYVLIQIARAGFQTSVTDLKVFFTLVILSIVLPLFVFIVGYVFANYVCKINDGEDNNSSSNNNNENQKQLHKKQQKQTTRQLSNNQKQQTEIIKPNHVQKRKSIFLTSDQSKTFGDDYDGTQNSGIKNQML